MSQTNKLEVIKDTIELWKYIKNKGGLDLKYYDKGIIDDLKSILRFSNKESFEKGLIKKNISIEFFLQSFLSALKPFSQMYIDLLKLFESENIKETNNNILIKFDFQSENGPTEFNLEHFKTWLKKLSDINDKLNSYEINEEYLRELSFIFHELSPVKYSHSEKEIPHTKDTEDWFKLYKAKWPNKNYLILPLTKSKKLNDFLTDIQTYLNSMIQQLSSEEIEYSNLYRYAMVDNIDKDDIRHYARLEVDFWTGSFLENYLFLVNQINNEVDEKNRNKLRRRLCEKLEKLFDKLPKKEIDVLKVVEELEELLQLPIWKKRYDFYSVWVITQIAEGLNDKNVEFISENGELCFSFAGTHLAKTKTFPHLDVWSELKTPLNNPIGKSRKRNIQPDYSILNSQIKDDTNSTILVVECKQYKVPSKKNFREALIDYANGRPNAAVVLVNYGPADKKILDSIEERLKKRTHIIGNMRPGNTESINEFRSLVTKYTNIDNRFPIYGSCNNVFEGANIEITLTWESNPKDLDLCLLRRESENTYKVVINYRNKKILNNGRLLELSQDITNGFGPEILKIKNLKTDNYLLAVHNYSNDSLLNSSNAKIEIKIKENTYIYHCPIFGKGEWWVLLELKNDSDLIIHNKIVNDINNF